MKGMVINMKLSISYKIVFVSVASVILSSAIIIIIGTTMTSNLLKRTLNNEMAAMQSLVGWIHEQEEGRLWHTIQVLAATSETVETAYAEDVSKIMEFAQLSLRQISANSITAANAEAIRVLIIIILCSLSVMFLIALAAGLIGNRIARPIRKLTDYAVQIADGNHNASLSVHNNDEMGQLANAMEATVSSLLKKLRDARAFNEFMKQELDAKNDLQIKMNLISELEQHQLKAEAENMDGNYDKGSIISDTA